MRKKIINFLRLSFFITILTFACAIGVLAVDATVSDGSEITLRAEIAQAVDGDTISITTANINLTLPLIIDKDITIIGDIAARQISVNFATGVNGITITSPGVTIDTLRITTNSSFNGDSIIYVEQPSGFTMNTVQLQSNASAKHSSYITFAGPTTLPEPRSNYSTMFNSNMIPHSDGMDHFETTAEPEVTTAPETTADSETLLELEIPIDSETLPELETDIPIDSETLPELETEIPVDLETLPELELEIPVEFEVLPELDIIVPDYNIIAPSYFMSPFSGTGDPQIINSTITVSRAGATGITGDCSSLILNNTTINITGAGAIGITMNSNSSVFNGLILSVNGSTSSLANPAIGISGNTGSTTFISSTITITGSSANYKITDAPNMLIQDSTLIVGANTTGIDSLEFLACLVRVKMTVSGANAIGINLTDFAVSDYSNIESITVSGNGAIGVFDNSEDAVFNGLNIAISGSTLSDNSAFGIKRGNLSKTTKVINSTISATSSRQTGIAIQVPSGTLLIDHTSITVGHAVCTAIDAPTNVPITIRDSSVTASAASATGLIIPQLTIIFDNATVEAKGTDSIGILDSRVNSTFDDGLTVIASGARAKGINTTSNLTNLTLNGTNIITSGTDSIGINIAEDIDTLTIMNGTTLSIGGTRGIGILISEAQSVILENNIFTTEGTSSIVIQVNSTGTALLEKNRITINGVQSQGIVINEVKILLTSTSNEIYLVRRNGTAPYSIGIYASNVEHSTFTGDTITATVSNPYIAGEPNNARFAIGIELTGNSKDATFKKFTLDLSGESEVVGINIAGVDGITFTDFDIKIQRNAKGICFSNGSGRASGGYPLTAPPTAPTEIINKDITIGKSVSDGDIEHEYTVINNINTSVENSNSSVTISSSVSGAKGIYFNNASDATVSGLLFDVNPGNTGVDIGGTMTDKISIDKIIIFDNHFIIDGGTGVNGGGSLISQTKGYSAKNITVKYNMFDCNNATAGVKIGKVMTVHIESNIVTAAGGTYGIGVEYGPDHYISYNKIIGDDTTYGISSDGVSSDVPQVQDYNAYEDDDCTTIEHNIFEGSFRWGIYFESNGDIIDSNDFSNAIFTEIQLYFSVSRGAVISNNKFAAAKDVDTPVIHLRTSNIKEISNNTFKLPSNGDYVLVAQGPMQDYKPISTKPPNTPINYPEYSLSEYGNTIYKDITPVETEVKGVPYADKYQYILRIPKTYTLNITKEGDGDILLPEVKFGLFYADDYDPEESLPIMTGETDEFGKLIFELKELDWDETGTSNITNVAIDGVSDSIKQTDGYVPFFTDGGENPKFILVELEPAEGYEEHAGKYYPFELIQDVDLVVKSTIEAPSIGKGMLMIQDEVEHGINQCSFTILNLLSSDPGEVDPPGGPSLPSTGGITSTPAIILGAALIAIGSVLLMYRKKLVSGKKYLKS